MKNKSVNNGQLVVGLDCSTTAVKAVVFDSVGNMAAKSSKNISTYSPKPSYYEQNSNEWWSATQKVLKDVTSSVKPKNIKAISIVNQRETFVALNKSLEQLRPAIIWLDERCKGEVDGFASKVGKRNIHRITGKPIDFAPVVYRLAWMKKMEPELYREIFMICDVQAYIVWKLTNSFNTTWASADPLGIFDIENKIWSKTILKKLNLKPEQLPGLNPPGEILGQINEAVSAVTGLKTGTLVVGGGGDGQAAGLGTGILKMGTAYLNLGTAVVSGTYGNNNIISKSFRTMTTVADKGYYYETSLRAGTFSIDWFIKKILKIDPSIDKTIYEKLENEASGINPGSDGILFLPYLSGAMNPYWDPAAKGAFIGLSSSHSRSHMFRAILEGIAFEQLLALNYLEKTIAKKIKTLTVIGGGSESRFWCQLIADITGKEILIPNTTEASGLGGAISAAVGSKIHSSFKNAVNSMTGIKSNISPKPDLHMDYQKIYKVYKKVYLHVKDIK